MVLSITVKTLLKTIKKISFPGFVVLIANVVISRAVYQMMYISDMFEMAK